MPPRGQELGKRRPFIRRPGINKFPSWDGMNRDGDPASCPPNAFRRAINVRIDDSEVRCRGGQTALNPDDALEGCIDGIFPPEPGPNDNEQNRLLISEFAEGDPEVPDSWIYAPDDIQEEDEDPLRALVDDKYPDGVRGWYWDGQRLLCFWQFQNDVIDAGVTEVRLIKESGYTVVAPPVAGYDYVTFAWEGSPGGATRLGADYYLARYDSTKTATEQNRLELISFGTSSYDISNEQAEDEGNNTPVRAYQFVTQAPDGRVIWLSRNESVATLTVRSTAAGTYSNVNFPTGFLPLVSDMHSWAWHTAKLYIGGDNGSGAFGICVYDPVLSTITLVRTVASSVADRGALAVHKGILYFAYESSGGPQRMGMLRAGVWTDQVFSVPNPDPINDICSFRDHLYITKGIRLFRIEDPDIDPTLEQVGETTSGLAFGYMVAVP
jgi:hypothetical protein